MPNSRQGFVIPLIIAIVAILVIAGTVYFADHKKVEAPATVDTSDWKTYMNEKYGFEFKYPSGWTILEEGNSKLTLSNSALIEKYKNSTYDTPLSLNVFFENSSSSLKDWIVKIGREIPNDKVSLELISRVDSFIKFEEVTESTEIPGYAFRKSGVNYYILGLPANEEASNLILSTFKFTTPTTTATTTKPISCKSEVDGAPVITSLSTTSATVGSTLEIHGCNLSGFEGDLDVYFERADGQRVILKDISGSYSITQDKLIKVVVKEPCQVGEIVHDGYSDLARPCPYVAMTPGVYKVYTTPWGKKSNILNFTILPKKEIPVACTMDAKMCPDGTYVGRSGPNCEFVCPANVGGNSAKLNQTVVIDGVKITPLEVVEDSRCPIGVYCVWAGTVKVKVRAESESGYKEEKVVTLMETKIPGRTGSDNIILKEVKPAKVAGQTIKTTDYTFTFSLVGSAY